MKTEEIASALKEIFVGESQRIVFWHDPEGEFAETITLLSIPDVTVLRIDQIGFLELKTRLEINEPDGKFLLYAPSAEPPLDHDWLLDIRLYSRTFRADRASLLLNELGLTHQTLRSHLAKRKAFFKSTDRTAKLKKLVQPTDLEETLDWKMLAVLTKSAQSSPFAVLLSLFSHRDSETQSNNNINTSSVPPCLSGDSQLYKEIEKFGLDGAFWEGSRPGCAGSLHLS